jgi:hypothetical protein
MKSPVVFGHKPSLPLLGPFMPRANQPMEYFDISDYFTTGKFTTTLKSERNCWRKAMYSKPQSDPEVILASLTPSETEENCITAFYGHVGLLRCGIKNQNILFCSRDRVWI